MELLSLSATRIEHMQVSAVSTATHEHTHTHTHARTHTCTHHTHARTHIRTQHTHTHTTHTHTHTHTHKHTHKHIHTQTHTHSTQTHTHTNTHIQTHKCTQHIHTQTPRYDSLKTLLSNILRHFLTLDPGTDNCHDNMGVTEEGHHGDVGVASLLDSRKQQLQHYLDTLPRNTEDKKRLLAHSYSRDLWEKVCMCLASGLRCVCVCVLAGYSEGVCDCED